MKIKEVKAKIVLDSRGEKTIEVSVNGCNTIAPSGKSTGKYENPPYKKDISTDVKTINNLELKKINFDMVEFDDLEKIEIFLKNKIGANTLFAFEASILKAIAKEQEKELWEFINPQARIFPRILSNTIGGGSHAESEKKTDFQEFLMVCNKNPSIAKLVNSAAYREAYRILNGLTDKKIYVSDENAWISEFSNEKTLEIMSEIREDVFDETGIHMDIGLDIASSQFFIKGKYRYNNDKKLMNKKEQINYISGLIAKYNLFYAEDPLDEEDFSGFAELVKKNPRCLIVGDDLTVTNLERVKKAIKMKAITGLIVKPNQTGSLIEVKKVIDLCKQNKIYTIISHRSGETIDSTIADLGFAFQVDFIKTPVIGKERLAKVERLIEIEKSLK
jgi:enolase